MRVDAAIKILKSDATALDAEALRVLFRSLEESGPGAQAANDHFYNRKYPEVLAWLKRVLSDNKASPYLNVRAHNLWSMQAGAESANFSMKLLESSDHGHRHAGASALRGVKRPDVVRALLKLKRDPVPHVREAVFRSLKATDDPAAIPALIEGIFDPDKNVAELSISGLASLKATSALPALVHYFQAHSTTPALSYEAVQAGNAIASISGQGFAFGIPGFCGTTTAAAAMKVAQGKKLGGEKGSAMVLEGEAELQKERSFMQKVTEEAQQSNKAERDRLQSWWEREGSRLYR